MVFAQEPQITINQPPNIRIGDVGELISALVGTLLIIAALLAFFYLGRNSVDYRRRRQGRHGGGSQQNYPCDRRTYYRWRCLGHHAFGPELPWRADYRWDPELPDTVLIHECYRPRCD